MIYRFKEFELDTASFELRSADGAIAIEPQVFTLLTLLVSSGTRLVSKEEIIEKVWNGRVVSDAALSSRIKSLRRILGDDGKAQHLIRTVHGKGFRFVGSVESAEDNTQQAARPAAGTEAPASDHGSSKPAILVLPFANMSGDAEQEYFSDAITQDIVTNLTKHRWLDVVARNTSMSYKGKGVDIRQLGRDLDVSYVVEGSVRRAGDRIRVSAQLVDAGTGKQHWSDRYDRKLRDVFEVQDEITAKIVARIEPEIGVVERRKAVRSENRDLKAWDCYHLGVNHFFKFTAEDNLKAQELLQRSRELDPQFGEAHAWWAYAVILGMVYWETDPSPELLDEALEATNLALDLDDQNAVFYALKARVQLARREYRSAVTENQMAINLNPTLASAYCGLGDSLAYEGRLEEAIEGFESAIELSPNDPQRWAFLTYGALAHIFRREFETAIDWAERAIEIPNCQYWTIAHKAVALAYLGNKDAAKSTVARLIRENPNFTITFARKKMFYLKDPDQLDMYLEGLALAGVPES